MADIFPSWTEWGLWSECFDGVRTKTSECFINREKVGEVKDYHNFIGCGDVKTESLSEPCEGTFDVIGICATNWSDILSITCVVTESNGLLS